MSDSSASTLATRFILTSEDVRLVTFAGASSSFATLRDLRVTFAGASSSFATLRDLQVALTGASSSFATLRDLRVALTGASSSFATLLLRAVVFFAAGALILGISLKPGPEGPKQSGAIT